MERGVWISAAVGFLAPVVMFSPLNKSEAWFAAWQKPAAKSAKAEPARADASRLQTVQSTKLVRVRHREAANGQRAPHERRDAKPAAAAASTVPPARPLDPKEQLARTIDPGARPDWYLIDPTLKRGDVLFLEDKVVVFRGRKIGNLSDYVPVSRTRMLSRKERRQIESLAARSTPGPVKAPAARAEKVAGVATVVASAAD